jgi:hypothetical protein
VLAVFRGASYIEAVLLDKWNLHYETKKKEKKEKER